MPLSTRYKRNEMKRWYTQVQKLLDGGNLITNYYVAYDLVKLLFISIVTLCILLTFNDVKSNLFVPVKEEKRASYFLYSELIC